MRRVPLVKQEMLTLPEFTSCFSGVRGRVARSFVFCAVFCRSLFYCLFLSFIVALQLWPYLSNWFHVFWFNMVLSLKHIPITFSDILLSSCHAKFVFVFKYYIGILLNPKTSSEPLLELVSKLCVCIQHEKTNTFWLFTMTKIAPFE